MGWPGADDRIDLSSLGVMVGHGEQVLWSGRPTQAPLVFRGRDVFLIPFSMVWGGFVLFWNVGVFSLGAPALSLFGLPFLIIGAYLTVGRFAHNWLRRSRTTYLLTNQRAIIATGFGRVRHHHLGSALSVETRLGRNGTGTIVFEPGDTFGSSFGNNRHAWGDWSATGMDGFQFYRVADVSTAINIVQAAALAAQERRAKRDAFDQQPLQDTPGWTANGLAGDPTGRPAPSPWSADSADAAEPD